MNVSEFRKLPSIEKILSDERLKLLRENYPHDLVVSVIRQQIETAHENIRSGETAPSPDHIISSVVMKTLTLGKPGLRRVINATGVILHTNLGRAPLSSETIVAMEAAATGYNNLEFDLETGIRGSRQELIEPLLCQITGAEGAMVVNNNAAAVLLGLSALAKRKEVIVSRGQAVAIGGGFRIPDVMRQSGAKLVEVGTTNITDLKDYEQAITPQTAVLMRVHSSNFKVIGYTGDVDIAEISALAEKTNLISFDDVGSGCFIETSQFGLSPEPLVQTSVKSGSGLVFFSGDKLMGGPQAGIIVGKKALVEKLKKHPLARAVRIDKVRLAGLAATLIQYLKGEALGKIPIWRMISMPVPEIELRAEKWAGAAGDAGRIIDSESMVGGGSLPGGTLPTKVLALHNARELAIQLRKRETPIVGRISGNMLMLDPRTVLPEEDDLIIKALKEISAL